MRYLFLSLFLTLGLAACGGGDPADVPTNQGGGGAGSARGGAPAGGGGTPAPIPVTIFDDTAIDLGVAGAFPSDLVSDGNGTLFTVDDATIPATIVGYNERSLGTPAVSVSITANDLIDSDGTQPARAPTTFGDGLFGAFTGDLEFAFGRWLLVTVSAGNSVTSDAAGPLRLANLVVIDTQTGKVAQTINLAWSLEIPGTLNDGAVLLPYTPQSLPAMVTFVPNANGTATGTVYVAMSNGAGSTAGLSVFFSGTVQSWHADFSSAQPLGVNTAGKAPLDVTRTYVTQGYNPVGLTLYGTERGFRTLIVTAAGASAFNANFVAEPTTDAVLEFLDLDGDVWRNDWATSLGPILPSTHAIQFASDGRGRPFGVLTSQTFAALYVVDMSGLEQNPVDPSRIGLLRTASLVPGGATTPGSGFQPGVALSLTGRSAVVASFDTSDLQIVGLPNDIAAGPILVNPAPFGTADRGPALGAGLGRVVLSNDPAAPFFFIVNGGFDANFFPNRNAFIGTLTVPDGLP